MPRVPAPIRANGNSRLPTPERRLKMNEKRAGGRRAETQLPTSSPAQSASSDHFTPTAFCLPHVPHPRPHRSPIDEPNRSARPKTGATSLVVCPRKGRAFTPEGEPCRWPL
jgi:hypothetical protein